MRAATRPLRALRLAAATLAVLVATGDAGSSSGRADTQWQWWQAQITITAEVSGFVTASGDVTPVASSAGPCGEVGSRPFDPRLLCPADIAPDSYAADGARLLLVGCQPWGRTDAAFLTDGTASLQESIVDSGSRATAVARLSAVLHRPACRDLGHGYRQTAPARTTVESLPAVQITEQMPAWGKALRDQMTAVAVGSAVLVFWSDAAPAEYQRLLHKAIARVLTPQQQANSIDIAIGRPHQCDSPPACASQDRAAGG